MTPPKPNPFASRYTHDCATGKPLPDFIRRGAVAYAPIFPKARLHTNLQPQKKP